MKSKAPLMLIEQLVLLLVFAVSAALCVQVFVRSDAISAESELRDRAVILVESTAETLRATSGDIGASAPDGAIARENGFILYYDKNGNTTPDETNAAYCLRADIIGPEIDGLGEAQVSVGYTAPGKGDIFTVNVMWQEDNGNA